MNETSARAVSHALFLDVDFVMSEYPECASCETYGAFIFKFLIFNSTIRVQDGLSGYCSISEIGQVLKRLETNPENLVTRFGGRRCARPLYFAECERSGVGACEGKCRDSFQFFLII